MTISDEFNTFGNILREKWGFLFKNSFFRKVFFQKENPVFAIYHWKCEKQPSFFHEVQTSWKWIGYDEVPVWSSFSPFHRKQAGEISIRRGEIFFRGRIFPKRLSISIKTKGRFSQNP